jgi:hypothetical protein
MQEQAQALSHIDLVLSQLPMNVLHNLQSSVTQEIQLHAELTSMELAKVAADNDALQAKYNKLVLERDEVEQRVGRLKNAVVGSIQKLPKDTNGSRYSIGRESYEDQ